MSVSTFTSGSGNWVADATEADVELWGGGGRGRDGSAGIGGGGGGGGEYAMSHITGLVIGNSYAYVVGGTGVASTFQVTVVRANPGSNAASTAGAAGGTGGTGTTKRNGGNGGSNSGGAGTGGGGGGGSAGTAAVGNNGSPNSSGLGGAGATAVAGGGAGGTGGTAGGAAAVTGFTPGGGGGGGGGVGTGANGANGQVRITTVDLPAMNIALTLSTLPQRTSFTPAMTWGFIVTPSLSTVKFESLQVGTGTATDINLELSTLPLKVSPPTQALTGTYVSLTLSTYRRVSGELAFGITIGLTLSTLPRRTSFTLAATYGTTLAMTLSTAKRFNPANALLYGTTVTLTSLSILKRSSGALFSYFVNPNNATKYVQAQKSGVEQILFGLHSPFLLGKAANNYRRRGKQQVIHTGKVKPEIKEMDAIFTIQTLTGIIQPGEFLYESTDGYLRITNPNVIDAMLVADGDTPAIDVQPMMVDVKQGVFFTNFHQ